jgi:DNA repair exonuclease SbcCD nuclease subunit
VKLLLFSDLHAANHQQFSKILPNGRNSRLQDCLNVIDKVAEVCQDEEVEVVLFLGDIFEDWRRLDADVFQLVFKRFSRLRKWCDYLYILAGNHDQYNKAGDITSIAAFSELAQVVDHQWVTSIEDLRIAFQPASEDIELVRSFSKSLPDIDLYCFHLGLKEAVTGTNNLQGFGKYSLTDLPTEKAKLCLGGDFHKRQKVAENVYYLGSPLQLNFGEAGQEKGLTLLDTTTWELKLIPTDAPEFYHFKSAADFWQKSSQIKPHKDFIRVACTKEQGEQIQNTFPNVQVEQVSTTAYAPRMKSSLNDEEVVREYTKRFHGELDEERLTKTGLRFLTGDK